MHKRVLDLLLITLGLSGCQLIQDQLDGNQPPILSDFVGFRSFFSPARTTMSSKLSRR